MKLKDYTPEDHELAKRMFTARGPAGLVSAQSIRGGLSVSIPRGDGYLAYLPQVRRQRLRSKK
jgi:hypothetical protein